MGLFQTQTYPLGFYHSGTLGDEVGMCHGSTQQGQNHLEATPAITALHTFNAVNITSKKICDFLLHISN